jgi:hypothetical protein
MAQAAKKIFRDDSMGRLQMIGMLHDFQNIDKHIDERPSTDAEELVWNAFFP